MRIGILTGGGDVPGLNPCIKAVVNRVVHEGHEVIGMRRGWGGLLEYDPDEPGLSRADWFIPLDASPFARSTAPAARSCTPRARIPSRVRPKGVPHILRTGSRETGRSTSPTHVLRVVEYLGIDVLIPIGGDDTLSYALRLHDEGVPVDRDPEDDGQRRPRHRLLHRVLDRGHARRRSSSTTSAQRPGRTSESRSSSCSAATAGRRR